MNQDLILILKMALFSNACFYLLISFINRSLFFWRWEVSSRRSFFTALAFVDLVLLGAYLIATV